MLSSSHGNINFPHKTCPRALACSSFTIQHSPCLYSGPRETLKPHLLLKLNKNEAESQVRVGLS